MRGIEDQHHAYFLSCAAATGKKITEIKWELFDQAKPDK